MHLYILSKFFSFGNTCRECFSTCSTICQLLILCYTCTITPVAMIIMAEVKLVWKERPSCNTPMDWRLERGLFIEFSRGGICRKFDPSNVAVMTFSQLMPCTPGGHTHSYIFGSGSLQSPLLRHGAGAHSSISMLQLKPTKSWKYMFINLFKCTENQKNKCLHRSTYYIANTFLKIIIYKLMYLYILDHRHNDG